MREQQVVKREAPNCRTGDRTSWYRAYRYRFNRSSSTKKKVADLRSRLAWFTVIACTRHAFGLSRGFSADGRTRSGRADAQGPRVPRHRRISWPTSPSDEREAVCGAPVPRDRTYRRCCCSGIEIESLRSGVSHLMGVLDNALRYCGRCEYRGLDFV